MIVDKEVECGDIIATIEKADSLVAEVDLLIFREREAWIWQEEYGIQNCIRIK